MPLIVLIFFVAVAMPPNSRADDAVTVPAGTVILVKMQSAVVTGEAKKGDPFTAVLEKSVTVDGRAVFPRGVRVNGLVLEAVEKGNISGRPAIGIHLVEIERDNGKVSIKTLSQGFIGTTQGTVNSVITGKVVGQAGAAAMVTSSGEVAIKAGALIEFSLVDPVEVN
jgi:hypothetical protein